MKRSDMIEKLYDSALVGNRPQAEAILDFLEEAGMRYCDEHWRKELGWEPEDDTFDRTVQMPPVKSGGHRD